MRSETVWIQKINQWNIRDKYQDESIQLRVYFFFVLILTLSPGTSQCSRYVRVHTFLPMKIKKEKEDERICLMMMTGEGETPLGILMTES